MKLVSAWEQNPSHHIEVYANDTHEDSHKASKQIIKM